MSGAFFGYVAPRLMLLTDSVWSLSLSKVRAYNPECGGALYLLWVGGGEPPPGRRRRSGRDLWLGEGRLG